MIATLQIKDFLGLQRRGQPGALRRARAARSSQALPTAHVVGRGHRPLHARLPVCCGRASRPSCPRRSSRWRRRPWSRRSRARNVPGFDVATIGTRFQDIGADGRTVAGIPRQAAVVRLALVDARTRRPAASGSRFELVRALMPARVRDRDAGRDRIAALRGGGGRHDRPQARSRCGAGGPGRRQHRRPLLRRFRGHGRFGAHRDQRAGGRPLAAGGRGPRALHPGRAAAGGAAAGLPADGLAGRAAPAGGLEHERARALRATCSSVRPAATCWCCWPASRSRCCSTWWWR